MAYSAPTSRSTGFKVTAAVWNQDVVDNVTFLANPPSCRVYNNATHSISNNTDTALTFNSERWDTVGMHSTSVNTSRVTVPISGLYLVTAHVAFAANATGIRNCWIRVNGTDNCALDLRSAASADVTSFAISTILKLSATNYIETMCKQTSGGSLNTVQTALFSPEMCVQYMGLGS